MHHHVRLLDLLAVSLWLAAVVSASVHRIPLKRHSFAAHRRRDGELVRRTASGPFTRRTVENDLLFSSSSILAPLQVGTPAQEIYVLLDTSSADLAVFGSGYSDQLPSGSSSSDSQPSTAIGPAFNAKQSTSYNDAGTTFQNNYGSGSSATFFIANDATDTIGFRGLTLTEQPLGVVQKGNVSYGPAASGIMGLAFEAASLGLRATPPLQQLVFANALMTPLFSFALLRPSAESEQADDAGTTQPGGIFTLGQLDGDQYEGAVGWSNLVSTTQGSDVPHKWLGTLDSITVNGKQVPSSQGIVANFDTGSSVSRGSAQLIDSILSQAENVWKDDDGNYYVPCGTSTAPAFNMTIAMGGVSIPIEPLDMLFKTAQFTGDDGQSYCYSTLTPTESDEYDLQIGDDVLRSMFVAFSFSPARVGIAAQSSNVHVQGAVPGYAFTRSRVLDTSTLTRPQDMGFSKVRSVPVDASAATTHVKKIGSETIRPGGTYVPTRTPTMEVVRASSTPAQIGAIATRSISVVASDGINRNPAAQTGNVKAVEGGGRSSGASTLHGSVAPAAMAWSLFLAVGLSALLAVALLPC